MNFFESAKTLFEAPRPAIFVHQPDHCLECQEAERNASNSTIEGMTLEQAGDGYANLLFFLNLEAYLYFFPAFIRLCLESISSDQPDFVETFLFDLTDGVSMVDKLSSEQNAFIAKFLDQLQDELESRLQDWYLSDEITQAKLLWRDYR